MPRRGREMKSAEKGKRGRMPKKAREMKNDEKEKREDATNHQKIVISGIGAVLAE